jgi:site-specific recombinase XerD
MKQARRIKFLEKDVIMKMADAIERKDSHGWRDYALIHVLFSTGLRISEALDLPVEPFLDPREDETLEVSVMGKGGKQRVVFFSPECVRIVCTYLEKRTGKDEKDPNKVFNITSRWAQIMIKERAKAVGLEQWITPHKIRHSMATHVLRQGANMRIVQELLGHSSIATTQIYAGVTNKDLLEAHKKFMI